MRIRKSYRGTGLHGARLLALALPLAVAMPHEAAAQGRTETVALTGQSAPGVGGGTFSFLGTPRLNAAGQTAFFASITGGTSTDGIFRSDSGSAPGVGGGTFSSLFVFPALNAAGQTAFFASITGGTNTQGIFRSDSGSALTAIARQGGSAPGAGGGTFSFLDPPVLNAAGQTAFRADITGGTNTQGIFRSDSGSALTAIARLGGSAPGAGGGTFSSVSSFPVLNAAGQTAFFASITGSTSTAGIFRSDSGSALTAIARLGGSAPGVGGGIFSFLDTPVLNDVGQTAFLAGITGGTSTAGIFRSDSGSALTAIARQGDSAPGLGGGTFSFFSTPVLNAAGQTAFFGSITGGTNTQGIFRSDSGSALTAIARLGGSAPGVGGGTFSSFFNNPVLNDAGQTAFFASITGGTSTQGAFLGDGRETVAVQLQGNSLANRTVSFVALSSSAINGFGQVAYSATFTDSSQGVFLFTPALRWRESFSALWDTRDHWTLGIAPASVHDVSIDPSATLTVVGPAGAASVRSLTVGSGTGFATLELNGGTLGSASAVQIAGRGILTGNGTISAQVVNAGEVRADNLILSGGLVNDGTVRGSAFGNQRIDADLTNNTAGLVRADVGEVLKLFGTAHTNAGGIEVRRGELQVTGNLVNATGGRIVLNDGIARFNSGLTNNGQVQASFGESEVFGNVTTTAGGKVILSGNSDTVFYNTVDMQSGAELRISTGSTAVFFGQVFQRTGSIFSGQGTKFYEGGLSVGASPGQVFDEGSVFFGAGSEYLAEVGGLTAGEEFDFLSVAGTLGFGGTLKLVSWEGFRAEAGQRFDLFDWGLREGMFGLIDASGFLLADGAVLDFSQLYVDGSFSVQAVPEPGTWALMLAGLGLLGWAARRRGRTDGASS